MKIPNAALATLALLTGPAVATAGPIDFNVAVTSSQQTVTPESPGPLNLVFDTQGNLQLPPGGSVELGYAHFLFPEGPQGSDTYTANTQFHVAVAVTDAASGQSDTLHVYGGAGDVWNLRWDGQWTNPTHQIEIGNYWLHEPFLASTTLGGHTYVLRVDTIESGTLADFVLYVDPGAGITTPEPAGLVLGALALFPVGLRAARRRLAKVNAHDPRGGV